MISKQMFWSLSNVFFKTKKDKLSNYYTPFLETHRWVLLILRPQWGSLLRCLNKKILCQPVHPHILCWGPAKFVATLSYMTRKSKIIYIWCTKSKILRDQNKKNSQWLSAETNFVPSSTCMGSNEGKVSSHCNQSKWNPKDLHEIENKKESGKAFNFVSFKTFLTCIVNQYINGTR